MPSSQAHQHAITLISCFVRKHNKHTESNQKSKSNHGNLNVFTFFLQKGLSGKFTRFCRNRNISISRRLAGVISAKSAFPQLVFLLRNNE